VQHIQENTKQNTIYTLEYIPHNTCEAIQNKSYHTNHQIQYKVRSCFNPSWQLSPTQLLAHCPERDGGENRKTKSEKSHGFRCRYFKMSSKSKHGGGRKQSKQRKSFAAGKQGSVTRNGYLGRQRPSLQKSPAPSSYPQLYTLSTTLCGVEYPFGHWGQLSRLCPLLTLCVPPACSLVGGGRGRKDLFAV